MDEYKKPYLTLWNAVTDALEQRRSIFPMKHKKIARRMACDFFNGKSEIT